ncbi:MAG: restriction endonuclease, partial [Lentisphaerae bacterium]|nr:restriction endonuclease [Lentisphaerota bacterium]
MRTKKTDAFMTIRTEGAILPSELLQRVAGGDGDLDGLRAGDYHLAEGEKLNERISSSWNRLLGVWESFTERLAKLPEKDTGTSVTRERWLLHLFDDLHYGRLTTSRAVEIEGKSYAISHLWQNAPIHLVGWNIDLDRRTRGVAGASAASPHSLVQEFLNRSDDHLWGFVSNGRRLRILRDNATLTRQAYVEFDLEAMMEGEVYSDFALLWLLCHQSRVEAERPEQCWLEKWSQTAHQQGVRALDHLRDGVEQAINALGAGFVAYPGNVPLRDKLRSGALDKQDYYRQLLRIVYRLMFLFVAEDRDLLLAPGADKEARGRYDRFYSASRLRQLAIKRRGTRHPDLWQGLWLVMEKLGSDQGCPELGLPALGSF